MSQTQKNHQGQSNATKSMSEAPQNQRESPATESRGSDNSTKRFEEWRSWKLEFPFILLMTLSGITMAAAIVALERLSHEKDGFVEIRGRKWAVGLGNTEFLLNEALLWTTIPVLVIQTYVIGWKMIVSAAVDRQPFIELREHVAAPAALSITLDYRTTPEPWRWVKALRNGHVLLGISIFFGLLTIILGPLTARLFATLSIIHNELVQAELSTEFNSSAWTTDTDLRPIFDVVSAIRINEARPPPWTDGEHAFPTLSLQSTAISANVTVNTVSIAAYLVCAAVPSTEYTTTLSRVGDGGSLRVDSSDRGCTLDDLRLTPSASANIYVQTWGKTNDPTCAGNSRFGLLAGTYSSTSSTLLSNFTLISCIPQYWAVPGTLSLTTGLTETPLIRSFARNNTSATQFRPQGMLPTFENELLLYKAVDPTGTTSLTEVGRLIYAYAQKTNPSDPLNAAVLSNAASVIFTSVFSILSSTKLYTSNDSGPQSVVATVSRSVVRLFVTPGVAYTIAVLLVITAALSVWIAAYSLQHGSILFEEPGGILSYADLLMDGNINNFVEEIRSENKYGGKVLQAARKNFDLKDTKCSVERPGGENSRMIYKITVGDRVTSSRKRRPFL